MSPIWQRIYRGYSDADMEILRLKIGSGIEAESARLDRFQRAALIAMIRDEIVALAARAGKA